MKKGRATNITFPTVTVTFAIPFQVQKKKQSPLLFVFRLLNY